MTEKTNDELAELTKEELDELQALEGEEEKRVAAEAVAAKRQHLDALRLSKRLAAKHGKPGTDFLVLETRVGNIAIRRPVDVEIDGGALKDEATREEEENYAAAITLEPPPDVIRKHMAEHHMLAKAIVVQSTRLIRVMREEQQKK